MITIKSEQDIAGMKASAVVLKGVFELMEKSVKPGITTKQLDQLAYDYIKAHGGIPSFLNYCGYPATLCTSIDDTVVHGIPGKQQVAEGQIVSIDAGVILNGYHSDAARSYLVGEVSPEKRKLVEVTKECFFKGVENLKAGCRLGDIGGAIQQYAESFGYGVVTALTGHGIGREMHEDPAVPNFGHCGRGLRLSAGMTLAIEPMINMGTPDVKFLPDGWTCKTKDGKPSAHYENTVLITETGVEIFTL